MVDKYVLTIAVDKGDGSANILVGDGIKIPENTEPGAIAEVRLGGRMSLPIVLQSFLMTFAQMKNQIMDNPELPEEDKVTMEQEIYDMLNISIGGYLDQGFPLVNARACLTEEACVEYGLDPKTATAEELLEAENKFIEEHPERASQTAEMELEPVKELTGKEGGPNRKTRRESKNK